MEAEDTRSQARKSNRIKDFLSENNVQEFAELCELRELGWQSEQADRHFDRQRTTADTSNTNPKAKQGFFKKMLQVAEEISTSTNVFRPTRSTRARVLDICMAPGAFSELFLRQSSQHEADAITLAPEAGGHEVLTRPNRRNLHIFYTDVTLHQYFLPAGQAIPQNAPDQQAITTNSPLPLNAQYDLVICDGQRLRTHEAADRGWEPGRLLVAQLVLGLTRIKEGGSMLLLLHRVEQWNTASLLYNFSRFSEIELFKPTVAHGTRSSFYLVARNIRPRAAAASEYVDHLRHCWYKMTFEGEEGRGMAIDMAENLSVDQLLTEFGEKLIEMGMEIWKRQKDALAASKWMARSPRT